MVRTRAVCSGVRVGNKASFKCTPTPSTSSSGSKSSRRYGSGNRYCPRETPAWQKEITQFLNTGGKEEGDTSEAVEETVASDVNTEKSEEQ